MRSICGLIRKFRYIFVKNYGKWYISTSCSIFLKQNCIFHFEHTAFEYESMQFFVHTMHHFRLPFLLLVRKCSKAVAPSSANDRLHPVLGPEFKEYDRKKQKLYNENGNFYGSHLYWGYPKKRPIYLKHRYIIDYLKINKSELKGPTNNKVIAKD